MSVSCPTSFSNVAAVCTIGKVVQEKKTEQLHRIFNSGLLKRFAQTEILAKLLLVHYFRVLCSDKRNFDKASSRGDYTSRTGLFGKYRCTQQQCDTLYHTLTTVFPSFSPIRYKRRHTHAKKD